MSIQKRLKLLPSLRERKRYVCFQVISENPISYSDLEEAIWNHLLDFYGEFGVSLILPWIHKELWNEKQQIGVIECRRNEVQKVLACL